jgi:hypothetical protein
MGLKKVLAFLSFVVVLNSPFYETPKKRDKIKPISD